MKALLVMSTLIIVNILFQNIIISSGTFNKYDIRNPHDIMNLYPFINVVEL